MIIDYAEGWGPQAEAGALVAFHYVLLAPDGTELDSTHARDAAFETTLGTNRLIPGFERGLVGVRAGMARKLVIPPALGYGDRKIGNIPGGTTLTFYVEVMRVDPS